ncbi:MAG: hypothetical protein ACWA6U_08365 [Breznakibacter sp.]
MIQGIDAIKISEGGWIVGGFCDCQMVLEVQLFDWDKISVLVFSRQESYSFKIIFSLFKKRNVLIEQVLPANNSSLSAAHILAMIP